MRNLISALAVAATLSGIGSASSQPFPSRPITMIVPYAVGGATDVIARIVGERMRVSLGQTIVIENITGANGSIAVGRVARAAPDGYTFVIGNWNTHVANGALYQLPYDLLKDFEPIGLISSNPWLIIARNAVPANDLKALIAWLKASPGKAVAGTAGMGSGEHVSAILFQNITGTRFGIVPYRGGAPAVQDLIAGQIDIMIEPPVSSLPQVRAGSIKVFATTANARLGAAPEIPTVDEAGLPGFYFSSWTAAWAPKGTPKNVIARLNAALMDVLADGMVRQRLADLGPEIFPRDQQTPGALSAHHKAEIEKWWPIIKAANIKGE
jgi:tripartite-type tricarboxylate transporter receptor subunit TctC